MIDKESNLKCEQEIYFAALEKSLRDVPAVRRAEFMDEVRAHLHAMVEAKRADGLDAEAVWLQTAAEFGEPEKVGRELRRQWADSAQLESEGVPLSLKRKWWIFVLPVVACVVVYAFATLAVSPKNNTGWQIPVLAAIYFGCPFFGIVSDARKSGGLKPSMIVGLFSSYLLGANCLVDISGNYDWGGTWRTRGIFVFIMLCSSLYFWLYKRERADRPWQFSARFKQSPIAAEQTYRLSPIVGLVLGNVLGCIGMISVGLQFFGLPLALLSCAALISGSVVLGKWLLK